METIVNNIDNFDKYMHPASRIREELLEKMKMYIGKRIIVKKFSINYFQCSNGFLWHHSWLQLNIDHNKLKIEY